MKKELLIVDDEKAILDTLERLFTLQDERFEVHVFENPLEALEWVKSHKVHIVLSDIKMPLMDGLTFLEELKKIDGQVQVIMMTGYTSFQKALHCFESGANDYILKPFHDLQQILEVIGYTVAKLDRWQEVIYASKQNKE
ncbi:response regulator [Deltaproteobacteria bacterium TL4]